MVMRFYRLCVGVTLIILIACLIQFLYTPCWRNYGSPSLNLRGRVSLEVQSTDCTSSLPRYDIPHSGPSYFPGCTLYIWYHEYEEQRHKISTSEGNLYSSACGLDSSPCSTTLKDAKSRVYTLHVHSIERCALWASS